MAVIIGTLLPDRLVGTLEADLMRGLAGSDTLFGIAGNDTIFGDTGNDFIYGGQGRDILYGNQGDDRIYGGKDDDTIYGGKENDFIRGDEDRDLLRGDLGDDTIYGGKGDDTIYGGKGNDVLFGDNGNDVLFGDLGTDRLFGGSGRDLFVLSRVTGESTRTTGGPLLTDADVIEDFEDGVDLIGLAGGLTFADLVITEGTGVLAGSTIIQDTLAGATPEFLAIIRGVLAANITAEDFTTTIATLPPLPPLPPTPPITGPVASISPATATIQEGPVANGGVDGSTGNPTIFTVTLSTAAPTGGLTINYARSFTGGAEATFSPATDSVTIPAGATTAQFTVSVPDNLTPLQDNRSVLISLLAGTGYSVTAGPGSSATVTITENDATVDTGATLNGTALGDQIAGGAGNDTINGNAGDDTLVGGAGDDQIYGGLGADSISGGEGNDTLVGGAGNDTLAGGAGSDAYVFNAIADGVDTIVGFVSATDTILISSSFGGGLVAGVLPADAFTTGAAATEPEHRFIYNGGNLFFDEDGDGAEAAVQIASFSGSPTLVNTDITIF